MKVLICNKENIIVGFEYVHTFKEAQNFANALPNNKIFVVMGSKVNDLELDGEELKPIQHQQKTYYTPLF